MRRGVLCLATLLLGSCSQRTELSARFIDGRLAFTALDGRAVDCVHYLSVVDVASGETMWELGDTDEDCRASLPVFYGSGARAGTVKPLVPGRRYEVGGSASGGNGMDGRFVISRATAYRVTDMPWDAALDQRIGNDALDDIANQSQ